MKKILDRFIHNRCNPAEIDELFSWVNEHSGKLAKQNILKSYWENIQPPYNYSEIEEQHRLDKIHHKINLNQSNQNNSGRKISMVQWLSRVAVILLIIPILTLVVYTNYFQPKSYLAQSNQQFNEVISPIGSRTHLELSDGTKVWLNHGSKMVYPQRFTDKDRIVLLEGEGYFDVAHNPGRPFIVKSGDMSVKAVGTSFNVKAYPGDVNFEAVLETGKVIITKETEDSEQAISDLKPGQFFNLNNATKQYTLKTVDPSKYVSWKDGKLVFIDDSMDDVAERLSRWFNVNINLEDNELKELTYTATFIDESLYQVLEMLEIVTPITFTISRREKLPNGTFTKREISIYKKNI